MLILLIKSNLPIVLVYGGSQGAKSINDAILGIIQKLKFQKALYKMP